jgi:hypothetical protein
MFRVDCDDVAGSKAAVITDGAGASGPTLVNGTEFCLEGGKSILGA